MTGGTVTTGGQMTEAATSTGSATSTEALVAQVWCELLEVDSVDATDNFFELGGHSLMATQAVFQLADLTGAYLELEAFFELGTVRGIAAEIDRLLAAETGTAYEEEL